MSWREAARSARQTLMGHDLNQTQAIMRAGLARGFGLDAKEWASPFTQNTIMVTYPPSDLPPVPEPAAAQPPIPPVPAAVAKLSDTLPKVLLATAIATAIATGVGGLGLGLWSAFKTPAASPRVIDNTVEKSIEVKSSYQPATE